MTRPIRRFHIALSFPGEHRPFVAEVAEQLAGAVGRERVLYDTFYEAEFARVNLDVYLQRLYHDESELIAVFLCADYERKEWCGLEWRAIRDLIKKRQASSVMPLRFDTTEIPGLFSTDGYIWIGDRLPADIASLILERWRLNSGKDLRRLADAGAGPESRCADATTRALTKALEESYRREEELFSSGADATAVRREILELRRQLREGGRLQAGDFLADGRFRLIEPLGRGGFATVWKAFDRRQRGLAAIKVLHGQFVEDRTRRERFFRGARKMDELHHPGIVRVTERYLQDGGYHFYVMEYLAGGDLREAVLGKRLAPEALRPLLQEVAAALSFAHEHGVIHRDVKPANILLDTEGRPKLTDFDLVRAVDTTGGTLDGGMLGTFLYSAPEQLNAPQDAGVAADVYSLGMTAIFCLYGAAPPLEILQDTGAFLRQLPCPSGLQEVLRKAIALRPEDRFGSVEELSRALAVDVTSPAPVVSVGNDAERQAFRRLYHPDPSRTEVELQVTYLGATIAVFWAADGTAKRHLLGPGGVAGPAVEIQGGILDLERSFVLRFGEALPALTLLTLQVGSSGRAGRGVVEVALVPRLVFESVFEEVRVHLRSGWAFADLLRLYRLDEPVADWETPQLRIREGEPPQTVDLRINTSYIERIDGDVIESGKCRAEVYLLLSVKADEGRESKRELRLQCPLELEQLPGHNWLAIAFGSSSIAAAMGNTLNNSFHMIPLQDIAIRTDGRTYGQEDSRNPEAGTPFLPSWVMCNADLRQEVFAHHDAGWRPGSPFFRPASLQPGAPSFLGLPALLSQLNDSPDRVIFSPMSWLGTGARTIQLQEHVKFLRQGQVVLDRLLPLDAVVESSFAALAEGYLYGQPADQVVICHPNTFTSGDCRRLHSIVSRALTKVFTLGSKHIHLVSESDAAAYYYCSRRMRGEPREGKERILVYDFKNETFDLSILLIEWNRIPFYPRRCSVEARMGLPIAGSYLDERLARIVDELLRDPETMGRCALRYAFPIVADVSEKGSNSADYQRAILQLYASLKEARGAWDGRTPFVLRVGALPAAWGVVRRDGRGGPIADTVDNPDRPALFARGDYLYLSVPAKRVHQDQRLVEYLEFVTEMVIAEVLLTAGLRQNEIDTLIVLGRDKLWPGLRERLRSCLPHASIPDIGFGMTPQEVVARGSISRQVLPVTEETSPIGRRLGVLLANNTLVPEEEWGSRVIDLTASLSFRLVQIGLRNPDPRRDMYSLRRYFYIDCSSQIYLRESLWREDPRLFVEKVQRSGKEVIALRNSKGQELIVDLEAGIVTAKRPPWPIGDFLLRPEP